MTRALLALCLVGCAPEPAGFVARSSTIVQAPDGTLWLTSPDDDALVAVDPVRLEEQARVAIGGEPAEVAIVGEALVVTLARAAEVAWVVDGVVRLVPVPCGGTRAVVPDGRGGAVVSCPNDDLVVGLDAAGVAWELPSPGRPTALGVVDDELAVTASRTGHLRRYSLEDRRLIDDHGLESRPGFAASQVDAVAYDPSRGGFVAAFSRVDHDSDRDRPPREGGYGSLVDGAPRIEPRLGGACDARYARYDGGHAVLVDQNPGDRHGRTRDLDEEAVASLVAYLETL